MWTGLVVLLAFGFTTAGCDSQEEVDVSPLLGTSWTVFGSGTGAFDSGSTWTFYPTGGLIKYEHHEAPVCGAWLVDGSDFLVTANVVNEVGIREVMADSIRLQVEQNSVLLVESEGPAERFADEAAGQPANFTQTRATGDVIKSDPEDWRASPDADCALTIEPAYPNPANETSNVTINIKPAAGLTLDDPIRAVRRTFSNEQTLGEATAETDGSYELDFVLGEFGVSGLYRILVLDAQDRLITYGDVYLNAN